MGAVEQAITKLDRELLDAAVRNDQALLGRVALERYIFINPGGGIRSSQSFGRQWPEQYRGRMAMVLRPHQLFFVITSLLSMSLRIRDRKRQTSLNPQTPVGGVTFGR
jgi:hypothetical protein